MTHCGSKFYKIPTYNFRKQISYRNGIFITLVKTSTRCHNLRLNPFLTARLFDN